MKRRMMIAGAAAVAVVGAVGGVAVATSGDDESVTGPGADQATREALKATGGGTANSVERDDENNATWEVEVTKPDGETVDVRLDENFAVVVIEGDSEASDEGADDQGESRDDDADDQGESRDDDADESGPDDDAGEAGDNVSGPDASRAGQVAVEAAGGGKVVEVDQDNEAGAVWEVEVQKSDGTTVDVRVDQDFKVLGVESDADSADEPGDD
ncbi:MAG: PepSY domain-containing protein [Nocardioidaceae bacterium]